MAKREVHKTTARRHSKRRRKFLRALARIGFVSKAAQIAGIHRRTAYKWRANDEPFAKAWTFAIEEHVDLLECEADRRAVKGIDRPIIYKGKVVATYKQYSDVLLMFRLKALAPEKYRERYEVERRSKIAPTVIVKTIDPYGVREESPKSGGTEAGRGESVNPGPD